MDLQQLGYVHPIGSHSHFYSAAGLTWAHLGGATQSWDGRSVMPCTHAWQLLLAVSSATWFSSTWPLILQGPLSPQPLGKDSQDSLGAGFQDSKNKGSYTGCQGLGTKVGHYHLGHIHWSKQVVHQPRFEETEINFKS